MPGWECCAHGEGEDGLRIQTCAQAQEYAATSIQGMAGLLVYLYITSRNFFALPQPSSEAENREVISDSALRSHRCDRDGAIPEK